MVRLRYPNIAAEQARLGLSREELASALGVSRRTLYSWMTRGNIPQSKLSLMADFFDCSADYLLSSDTHFE